jgi:hypothetical protein
VTRQTETPGARKTQDVRRTIVGLIASSRLFGVPSGGELARRARCSEPAAAAGGATNTEQHEMSCRRDGRASIMPMAPLIDFRLLLLLHIAATGPEGAPNQDAPYCTASHVEMATTQGHERGSRTVDSCPGRALGRCKDNTAAAAVAAAAARGLVLLERRATR